METTADLAIVADPEGQVKSLQDTLHKVQAKFVDWLKHLDSHIDTDGTSQLSMVAKQEHVVTKLEEKLKALRDEQELKRTASVNTEEEMKRLLHMVDMAQRETDSLLLQKEHLVQNIKNMKERNCQQKELLDLQNTVTEKTTQELEKSVAFFRDRLGLQLKNVSGKRMQLIFTCMDYKQPSHPYYCFVKIAADRSYEVSECTPEVNEFDDLVAKLNKDNDFKSFVVGLRRAFKATV